MSLLDANGRPISTPKPDKPENPFEALDYTADDVIAFIQWWRAEAFPKLKEEFGDLKWTTMHDGWLLGVFDQESGTSYAPMRPADRTGNAPFYLEPKPETVELIAALFRASRALHDAARGRGKPEPVDVQEEAPAETS